MLSNLLADLRYSLRSLFARPGFTLVAVLTLALGIGANTAIFSVVHGLFLAPLPYPHGERLVDVHNRYPGMNLDYAGSSIPDYLDRKEQAPSLEDLALYTGASFNLAQVGDTPERLVGLRATPSLFTTLGVRPALGRVFGDEHAVPGNDKVLVLGHAVWKNRFNADPGIVGRELRLSGETWTVLGVMPEGFGFLSSETQVWTPFAFTPEQRSDNERGYEYSQSIGRLREGASIDTLNAEVATIVTRNADRLAASGNERSAGFAQWLRAGNFTGRAQSYRELQVGENRPMVLILQGAVALVLLIAVANVANLLLTRLIARQKELSVRNALGASRARLVRQVLIEALLVSIGGGLTGVVLAVLLLRLLPHIGLEQAMAQYRIGLNLPVLGFALVVSLVTGVLAAVVPVLSLFSGNLSRNLNDSGRLGSGGRVATASRNAMVVAQVALATALLVGAGLLLRSFVNLQDQSPGFDSRGVLTAMLNLPEQRYLDHDIRARFYEDVLREARAIPGIEQASWTSVLPFSGNNSQGAYDIDGRQAADEAPSPHGMQRQIDEDYFATLEIPLLAGRTFTAADSATAEPVVIVDELLAKKYFEGADAIGQRIRLGGNSDNPWLTVVGVVGTIKHGSLRERTDKETLYLPYRQQNTSYGALMLRGPGVAAAATADALRAALRRIDPEQPVHGLLMLDARIALSLQGQRAPMNLIGGFAAVALILSAVGIYAVLAFIVGQRSGELGVRMAIGARRTQILALVLGQGTRLTVLGLGLGVLLAQGLGQLAKSQLFGVSPYDPLTLLVVPPLLGLIALIACWLPARRATRIDPLAALRHEG